MLVACPSWDETVALDWELGRKGAPIFLAISALIREHPVEFPNIKMVKEQVVTETPAPLLLPRFSRFS